MFHHCHRLVLSTLVVILLSACSSSEEPAERGSIEKTTDKIAKEAVVAIKTPVEQAKLAKERTEKHHSSVEKNVNRLGK